MLVERDHYGTYGSCLNCGYFHDVLASHPIDLAAEEAALPVRLASAVTPQTVDMTNVPHMGRILGGGRPLRPPRDEYSLHTVIGAGLSPTLSRSLSV